MSIRCSADNMGLERTANLPSTTSFLVMGKSYIVNDRSNTTSQHLVSFAAAAGGDFAARLAWGDFTNTMTLFTYDGTINNFVDFASRPATGRWFFWYMQCAGSGAGQLTAGWGYCDSTAAMVTPKPAPDGVFHVLEQWRFAPDQVIFIGDSPNDEQTAQAGGVSFVAYRNPALDAAIRVDSFKELTDILRAGPLSGGA